MTNEPAALSVAIIGGGRRRVVVVVTAGMLRWLGENLDSMFFMRKLTERRNWV